MERRHLHRNRRGLAEARLLASQKGAVGPRRAEAIRIKSDMDGVLRRGNKGGT